jgi:hypothetical protein
LCQIGQINVVEIGGEVSLCASPPPRPPFCNYSFLLHFLVKIFFVFH